MSLKKLRAMSLGEIGYRLKTAGTRKCHALRRESYRGALRPERYLRRWRTCSNFAVPFSAAVSQRQWPEAEEWLLQHTRARFGQGQAQAGMPRFFIDPRQRASVIPLAESMPAAARDLAEANRLLHGNFSYLGIEAGFPGDIDWHLDPLTQRRWPQKFYTTIKFYGQRHGEQELPGDVKYVWELNRHQHFTVLGKAYWRTGEEQYATALLGQCDSWIEQNPYLWGINWTSALEVGMRALSWLWAYFFCLHAQSMTPLLHARLLRTLQLHGRYLSRHLSFYTSPYNHLVGEAVALFALGLLFQEFPESQRWRQQGWKILTEEATRQFHADGMSVEQAVSYHHFTLGLYLQAVILAQHNGVSVPAHMRERLERALEFCMHSQQPDGRHPMIGDNDNAFAFYFGEKENWDFREYLALGAILFARGDFKLLAGHYHEACLWLLGPQSYPQFEHLPAREPEQYSVLMREGGYAVLRDEWRRDGHCLIFDCGPQSHGLFADEIVSTAHGHADALSFTLCAYGHPFLIDSGMLTYNGELAWQNHFRGGQAHNTITVDGRSASKIVGRLGYSHVSAVEQTFFERQKECSFVEAAFTGFGLNIKHQRGIFYHHENYWLILDGLEGQGEHVIERWFHFAPDLQVRQERNQVIATSSGGERILLCDLSVVPASIEVFCGGQAPEQGWIAPHYGGKIAAPALRLRLTARLPVQLITLVLPCAGQIPALRWDCSGERSTSTTPFHMRLCSEHWDDQIELVRQGAGRRIAVSRRAL